MRQRSAGAVVVISKWMRSLLLGQPKVTTSMALTTGDHCPDCGPGGVCQSGERACGMIGLLGAGLARVMLAIAVIDGHSFVVPDELNAATRYRGRQGLGLGDVKLAL